jgi:hypothetical protein
MVTACLATTMLLASPAFAESLSWQYIDLRYLQPSDTDTRGFSGEVSGHISDNWLLQGRVNRIELKDSDVDLRMSQMRYDLVVGRTFAIGARAGVLVSAGYTHLDYSTDLGTFEEDEKSDAANVQAAIRARFAKRFEAEAGLGLLFDDKDTSDLLWNVGLRYWASESISLLIGATGANSDSFADDILYEIGFRFDLR